MASHSGGSASIPGLVMWDLRRMKWRWGRFSSNAWFSHDTSLSNEYCAIIIHHPGQVQ
jgi:hypothetical protein